MTALQYVKDISQQYEGLIINGHGSDDEAAGLSVSTVESNLDNTKSRLSVLVIESCHGYDMASKLLRDGYTTADALVVGYSGYGSNLSSAPFGIGNRVKDWTANPTFTTGSYYNAFWDPLGTFLYGNNGSGGLLGVYNWIKSKI